MLQVFQKLPALRHGPRQVLLLAPDIGLQPIRRRKAPTRNVEVARLRDVGIELDDPHAFEVYRVREDTVASGSHDSRTFSIFPFVLSDAHAFIASTRRYL